MRRAPHPPRRARATADSLPPSLQPHPHPAPDADLAVPDAVHQVAAARAAAPPRPPDPFAPPPPDRPSVAAVALATTAMAACAGLGALPYFLTGSLSPAAAALASAAGGGVMLAAAFDLIHEGEPYGPASVAAGVVAGAVFIRAIQGWLEGREDVRLGLGGGTRAGARPASSPLVVLTVMAAHALGEGAGVGVSFCGARGASQGALVALAIAVHNVPEGLATAAALAARGVRPRAALAWTLATAAPQPLLAVPAFMFVDAFRALLPGALGFAAGCMLWLVGAELIPAALAAPGVPAAAVGTTLTLSAAGLEAVRMAAAAVERGGGSGGGAPASPSFLPALLAAALAGGLSAAVVADATPAGASTLGLAAGALGWAGGAAAVAATARTPPTALAAAAGAAVAIAWLRAASAPTARSRDGGVLAVPVGAGLHDGALPVLGASPPRKGGPRRGPPLPAPAATAGLLALAAFEVAGGWAAGGASARVGAVATAAHALLPGAAAALLASLVTGRSLLVRAGTGAAMACLRPLAAAAAPATATAGPAAAAAGALAAVAVAGLWPAAAASRRSVASRTAAFGACAAGAAGGVAALVTRWW